MALIVTISILLTSCRDYKKKAVWMFIRRLNGSITLEVIGGDEIDAS